VKPYVSMPSSGLYPFPHTLWSRSYTTNQKCQCPQAGFIHFHPAEPGRRVIVITVSMPSSGLYPFPPEDKETLLKNLKVSMPSSGLYPFPQYPFKNPVFMRPPASVFVNNSQNILNSIIFSLFFGFLIFYIYIICVSPLFVNRFFHEREPQLTA